MTELCPKCGTEMEQSGKLSRAMGIEWRCPLDPKDCRIKELENRVCELTQRDPSCYDMSAADAFRFAAEKQNKVVELERQLEEAKAHEIEAWDAKSAQDDENWKFIENLKSERDAARLEVVALRKTLEACFDLDGYPSHDDGCPEDDTCECHIYAMVNNAFSHTSATAQQTVERIEREALEKAWLRLFACDAFSPDWGYQVEACRAAILGERGSSDA